MENNIVNVELPTQKGYSYPIIIGEYLLQNAEDYIKKYTNAKKYLVVTNETVYKLYGEKLNLPCKFVVLADGEEYKNFENYKMIIDVALQSNLERTDAIVALGGGVVGDMTGFAAATYLRGIDFIQIPTTLLAQVDSSVGGKVAINHSLGKNLIGAFYQPKLVLSDINTLHTLDKRQFASGLGEVLKYAFIENTAKPKYSGFEGDFFSFLSENKNLILDLDNEILAKTVEICCEAKATVVNKDEHELGLRAILNLGHTFAHAIENCTEYKSYTHGEAVAIGTKMAIELSLNLEYISSDYAVIAKNLLEIYNLNFELDKFKCSTEKMLAAMSHDKKNSGNKLKLILFNDYNHVGIFSNVDSDKIKEVIASYV